MFDNKFLITLLGLIVAVVAINNIKSKDEDEDVQEDFFMNPSMTWKVDVQAAAPAARRCGRRLRPRAARPPRPQRRRAPPVWSRRALPPSLSRRGRWCQTRATPSAMRRPSLRRAAPQAPGCPETRTRATAPRTTVDRG